MSKTLILIYGVIAYFIGVLGLACIIYALANLLPYGFLWTGDPAPITPIVWDFGLVGLWGFIHSVMARDKFKAWIIKYIPEAAERSTYILVSGLTSIMLIGYWQAVPGQAWHVENTGVSNALWVVFVFGWIFLLASTFAINHFDLFGLRQVYLNFKNQPRPPVPFAKRAMYKYIRHPIQTGVLLGVWATPSMSNTQLILSLGFTAYIFIGLWFEERDLTAQYGDDYRAYQKETGKVLPKFFK